MPPADRWSLVRRRKGINEEREKTIKISEPAEKKERVSQLRQKINKCYFYLIIHVLETNSEMFSGVSCWWGTFQKNLDSLEISALSVLGKNKKSVTRYFPTAEEKLIHRDFPSFPASHKIRGGRRRAKTIARTTKGEVDSFLFSSFSAKGLRKGEDFQPRRKEGRREEEPVARTIIFLCQYIGRKNHRHKFGFFGLHRPKYITLFKVPSKYCFGWHKPSTLHASDFSQNTCTILSTDLLGAK